MSPDAALEAPALEAIGLRRSFGRGTASERLALAGVSLRLAPGEFAVVIGSNGAGKSTLLNALAGEVTLDAGSIRIAGQDVTKQPTHRRAALVARVFQDPLVGTAGPMTIAENLAIAETRGRGRGLRAGLTAASRRRYAGRLEAMGLGLHERMGQSVATLSGGQRQALALAMAVLATPRLLLLDEHIAALDPRMADVIMRATVACVRAEKLTTLMVTHNMQHAIDHGDRLVMMLAGQIIFEAAGPEKAALTVEALVQRFHLTSDRMILA